MLHIYRDADNEPAYMADQIAEHNRVVGSFESFKGQELAQAAYEFWRDEFDRDPSAHANRLCDVAGGLASLFQPWMAKVGYLTESDRHDIVDFKKPPLQAENNPNVTELEKLNRDLSTRQAKEAAELHMKQESQTFGDPAPWQQELYPKQCEALEKQFAEERERYNSEYQAAQRIADEIRTREKEHATEQEFPPELQNLLQNLSDRQEEERLQMELIHDNEGIPDHMEPEEVGRHNEKQMHDLAEKHATERERYIKEFYDAQRIAEEMSAADKAKAMDQGEEKGFSK